MWYKYNEETNEWFIGNAIYFPNGIVLKDNYNDSYDGWNWYDEAPVEYIDWLNNNIN